MNKIGIITLHPKVYNYGGFLQEMALQDAISSLGGQCEIINYDPSNELNTFSMKRGIRYFSVEKVLRRVWAIIRKPSKSEKVEKDTKIRKAAFDAYRERYLKLSEPLEYLQLHSGYLPYDVIICGSDQIWNPDYNIPSFFLGFAREDQKKVIYAASVGKTQLTQRQMEKYETLMRDLDYISVREKSARDMLAPISPKQIELVLDPTMLHDRVYWEQKAQVSTKTYNKYMFCYFLDLTKEKVEAARKYAQKRNCQIVAIPYLHERFEPLCHELADVLDSDVSPADFLKLIRDAEHVLTDSFHAAVFSIIFKKDFWVFGRSAESYNMNTRLDTLLGYFDISDRMIRPMDLDDKLDEGICIKQEVYNVMKEKSYQFLKEALA